MEDSKIIAIRAQSADDLIEMQFPEDISPDGTAKALMHWFMRAAQGMLNLDNTPGEEAAVLMTQRQEAKAEVEKSKRQAADRQDS